MAKLGETCRARVHTVEARERTVRRTTDNPDPQPDSDSGSDLGVVQTPDGRELGVCRWGDPDGAPVLWLHGMPGSRYLRHVGDGYLTHRLCVYTFDRPGYGRSSPMPGRRIVDGAADVRAVADGVGLDRFAVGGVSAGAPHALAAAALLTDRVVRCAVVVPPAPVDAEGLDYYAGMGEHERQGDAQVAQGGPEQVAEAQETWDWVEAGMPGLDLGGEELTMFTDTMREAFRQGPRGYLDDGTASMRAWGFALEDVGVPTKVMVARDDLACPPAHGEWLARHLPHAELLRVDGGHLGPRDEPEMQLMAWLGHGGRH